MLKKRPGRNITKLRKPIHIGTGKNSKPMYMEVGIESQQMKMDLDMAVAVSLIPYQLYQENFAHLPIEKTHNMA